MSFVFWEVLSDGTAVPTTNHAAVDANPSAFYGSIESAIIHGGVRATAFTRETVATYDAKEWLATGRMILAANVTIMTITAERE